MQEIIVPDGGGQAHGNKQLQNKFKIHESQIPQEQGTKTTLFSGMLYHFLENHLKA